MKISNFIDNSKLYEAFRKSKYFRKTNHIQIKSGRFPNLPRFTKIQNYLLECLYSIPDMRKPSAYRLYLYLLRQITGYNSRYLIEYNPKRIKAQLNINNGFYNAIKNLEEKNMIYYSYKDDIKYIGLNPYPDTWITNGKDRIDEIIEKEVNELLGIEEGDLVSISSSSWSSSSSSSNSLPSDDSAIDEILMRELEKM